MNGKKQRKQKSKVAAEGVETDYVRVKARRGQATDSHSLAERVYIYIYIYEFVCKSIGS